VSEDLFALLQSLATESRNPRTRGIDLASSREILDLIHAEDRLALDAVGKVRDALAALVDDAVVRWLRGGRLVYAGAGTSGRLGVLDAAELPPTYSVDPARAVGLIAGGRDSLVLSREGAEDHPEDAVAAVAELDVDADDVVIGLSASYRTPYAQAALRAAKERDALTAFFVCNRPPEPLPFVDHMIVTETGPEAVAGSTRMKAALAQKMLLTMFSTTIMIRAGKVFENLMVDLKPTSAKLAERSRGLVMLLGGADYAEAARCLEASGGDVKAAVIMARRGLDAAAAFALLGVHRGRLRAALDAAGEDPGS